MKGILMSFDVRWFSAIAVVTGLTATVLRGAEPALPLRFDFGATQAVAGYTQVASDTAYSEDRGFGFEPGGEIRSVQRAGSDPVKSDFCTSDKPFGFSVKLPEGNYRVTVVLGDTEGESDTSIRAETRRLMLKDVRTSGGAFKSCKFAVNVRNSRIGDKGSVKLNDREKLALHWDDKLTLGFSGGRPCVCSVEIAAAPDAVTVYIAGDSTVTDQLKEPWAGWGQMLPCFFDDKVAVANHAESGRALSSFRNENRLEKILSQIKRGDYLLIQFGHNDQKEKGPNVGAFTTYKQSLKQYIAAARERGATPVLITPMHRRRFDDSGHVVNSLGDYPEAVRQTAQEDGVALIDLNAMSKTFYESLGVEGSKKAFVHYPANTFPGQDQTLKDDTHFNEFGAYELAKCVVRGMVAARLDLVHHLREPAQATTADSLK